MPAKGSAKVLAVIAEDDQIVLKDVIARPPDLGDSSAFIRLATCRPLRDVGLIAPWAASALACLDDLAHPEEVGKPILSQGMHFSGCVVPSVVPSNWSTYTSSFLFGPRAGVEQPVERLLAEYLQLNPRARVLLLSTTNLAVDQATVAVDKALGVGWPGANSPARQAFGQSHCGQPLHGSRTLVACA